MVNKIKKVASKIRKALKAIRVGVYNLGAGSDKEKSKDLDELAAAGVQLLGLVEHADHDDMTSQWVLDNPDWAKWSGENIPGGQKTCILWKKSLGPVTAKKSVVLTGRMRLNQGAGPENAGAKVSNRIRLRIGGRRVHFIVGHQYATVHNRRGAALLFLRALTDVVRRRIGIVILVGDMNQPPSAAMHAALRRLLPNFTNKWATHGRRIIDVIWTNRKARIRKSWTMQLSSDHKALLADIEF